MFWVEEPKAGETTALSPTQAGPVKATTTSPGTRTLLAAALAAVILVPIIIFAAQAPRPAASPPSAPLHIEQVLVSGGADPNTEVTLSWASAATAAGTASTLQYGLAAGALPFAAPVACMQYAVASDPEFGSYASPYLCSAVARLPPSDLGSPLHYRIGDPESGYFVGATATAPRAGAPGVRLAVLGDLGTTADSVATLEGIRAAGPFAAILFAGDLSYGDGNQSVWDTWGSLYSAVGAVTPTYFLPGNHEWFDLASSPCDYKKPPYCNYTFQAYLARTHSPSVRAIPDLNSLYYSFNLGLLHVIMLQGYCPQMKTTLEQPCLAAGSAQLLWLQGDLARVDRAATPWVVVAFHQPFVNSNTAHKIATEGVPIQNAVESTLYGSVDLVLSGHVHSYERSCRAFNLSCVADGPVYIVVGDGGNREGLASVWVEPQPSYSLFRQASFGHGEIYAPNATHLQWTWQQNPSLTPASLDSVWLVKGQAGEVGPGVTRVPQRRALRS